MLAPLSLREFSGTSGLYPPPRPPGVPQPGASVTPAGTGQGHGRGNGRGSGWFNPATNSAPAGKPSKSRRRGAGAGRRTVVSRPRAPSSQWFPGPRDSRSPCGGERGDYEIDPPLCEAVPQPLRASAASRAVARPALSDRGCPAPVPVRSANRLPRPPPLRPPLLSPTDLGKARPGGGQSPAGH